jgi:hypothetical protein
MGVQLGDLVEAKNISIDDLSGRAVAFDGHNVMYQFLSIIHGQTHAHERKVPISDPHVGKFYNPNSAMNK